MLQLLCPLWFRYRARGLEQIPATGGCLLLINHQSFLDPLLVGLPLQRPVSFVARDNLFHVPVVGWVLRSCYVLPINRDGATTAVVRESIRRVEQGFLVGLFPEGTRSENGRLQSVKPGFLAIARRAAVPIIPVGIDGAHLAFPRGARMIWPASIRVVFGPPLPTFVPTAGEAPLSDDALLARVTAAMQAVHASARAWREGSADQAALGDVSAPTSDFVVRDSLLPPGLISAADAASEDSAK